MVTPELVDAAKALLGQGQRILVTGGSGFVGSHLARTLNQVGHVVTTTGRNAYRLAYGNPNLHFARVDLRDRERILQLCEGQDLVYHVAAKTAPWGDPAEFQATNVEGTRNIADGCLRHGVKRLVHVSSTAIFFEFKDKTDIKDDAPLPRRFSSAYAASKAAAEEVIRAAHRQGLNTFIVRARAVIGPGDNHLLPRLLHLAQRKKLRQVGGDNVLDFTYIDNLIYALLLAGMRGESGGVCTVTDGAPVSLWPLLRRVLNDMGFNQPLRRVPYPIAYLAAGITETLHRLRRAEGEPAITRYSIGLLSKTQTFDPGAAQRHLGYRPLVSTEDGLRRTVAALQARDDSHTPTCVQCRLFTTGYTEHPRRVAERGGDSQPTRFHAAFALLEHPRHGLTLFDTGYSPRFLEATQRWPYRLYRKLTPVVAPANSSACATLQRAGISVHDIRRIVISHFHADHLCGLIDFPQTDVIATQAAWHSVRGRRGIGALRRAYLPGLIPADLEDRLHLIDHFHEPGMGPLENCHDLFGDGSVRLFELPGHAVGQMGALVQIGPTERRFLLADAVWTTNSIARNLPATRMFNWLAASESEVEETRQRLVAFHAAYPEVELIPTHCPQVAQRYEFDGQLAPWLVDG